MGSYFVVQSYSQAKGGMTPDAPIQAQSLTRDGNPKTGYYGDPKLIYAHGDNLPEEISDMERV